MQSIKNHLKPTLVCVLAFLLGCRAATGLADTQYTITDLGAGFVPQAINSSGQVVGFQAGGGAGLLYSGGSVTTLWGPGIAYGINNSGQVVGVEGSEATGFYPVEYANGITSVIGPAGGFATAINDKGAVVGGYNPNGAVHAVSFAGGQAISLLGNFAGNPYAVAINDNNQTVVWGQDSTHEYAYTVGGGEIGVFQPAAINNTGEVIGSANGPNGVLYNNGSVQNIPGFQAAFGINSNGDIVGEGGTIEYGNYSGGYDERDARLYSNGNVVDFDDLLYPTTGWLFYDAISINDGGQIVGLGNPTGNGSRADVHGFLLTPVSVPEPASITMSALGTLCLLRRRRRK